MALARWEMYTSVLLGTVCLLNAARKSERNDSAAIRAGQKWKLGCHGLCLGGCPYPKFNRDMIFLLSSLLPKRADTKPVCECPSGFKIPFYPKNTNLVSCYLLELENIYLIRQAEAKCGDEGAQLVSIESKEENQHLYAAIPDEYKDEHRRKMIWISAKMVGKDKWVWMATGQEVDYNNWSEGTSLNIWVGRYAVACAWDFEWAPNSIVQSNGVICEKIVVCE